MRAERPSSPTPLPARCVLALLLAPALLTPPVAIAQQPHEADFEEEVRVTEVLLDALVTDSKGNVVLGLGADDFVVEEEGEPVELESVTFYSNRRFLEGSAEAERLGLDPATVPAERYFILFFHDQRRLLPRLGAQLLDAGRWGERWVRSELLPNDHVAVVGYDVGLELYQDFTTDTEALVAAIGRAARSRGPEGAAGVAGEGSPSLFEHLPAPDRLGARTRRIYDALEVLGEAAAAVRGRKNLVLFSVGFGEVNDFGLYQPDPRYYPEMVRRLNDGGVAVYTVDLIPTTAGGAFRRDFLTNALSTLADDTGGRYFFNFVNFSTPLERIARENNGYYLLAYGATHPEGESGYQEVRVDTVNPRFRVRARQGYYYGEEE